MMNRHSEQGNILFLILIAVALFAALSFAVTQSTRSGGGDASDETLALQVAEILQYATLMENTVMRMRISNGCSDTDISFDNPVVAGYTHTPPQPNKCKVFHPGGGGLSWRNPNTDWEGNAIPAINYTFNGENCIENVGLGGANCNSDGIDNEELIFFLNDLNQSLCIKINEKLGVNNPGGLPPSVVLFNNAGSFAGAGSYSEAFIIKDGTGTLIGQRSACIEFLSLYFFYHVLIPR